MTEHSKTKRRNRQVEVKSSISWRDHLSILSWILMPLLLGVILVVVLAKVQWNRSIDDRLAAWQKAYKLDVATVRKLRSVEIEFHGTGNPFTSPIARSPSEIKAHHAEMASLMEAEMGRQFLKDIGAGRWSH